MWVDPEENTNIKTGQAVGPVLEVQKCNLLLSKLLPELFISLWDWNTRNQ